MHAVQSWCYTLSAGVIFCGIISMLVPSERYRPIMKTVLGLFMLVSILSFGKIGKISFQVDTDAAEQRREQVSGHETDHFLLRVLTLTQERAEKAAAEYLEGYGIKRDHFQIYMRTEDTENGEAPYLELTLPQEAMPYQFEIHRALAYEMGMDVRISYVR